MPSVTFLELQNRVEYMTSEKVSPNGKTTPSRIQDLLNSELEQYFEVLCSRSDRALSRYTTTTSASETVGADGFPANQKITLPTTFAALRSAAILNGQDWAPLSRMSETERSNTIAQPGLPCACAVAGAVDGTTVLRLEPPADGAYSIEVLYVPKFTAALDSQTVELVPAGDDWLVSGAALQVLAATGAQEPGVVRMIQDRYAMAREQVTAFAARQNRSAPRRMRETDRSNGYPRDRYGRWLRYP